MKNPLIAISLACILSLTACNSGSSSSTTPVSVTPTSTPAASQTIPTTGQAANTAFPVALSSAVATSAGISSTSFTLPFTLPANTSVTADAAQPSSILVPFSSRGPVAQSARATLSQTVPDSTAYLFFGISTPTSISLNGNYAFQFTLANTPLTTANYFVAIFDGSQWHANATGSPATISGNTLTFAGTFPSGLAISPNTVYGVALYSLPLTNSASVTTATSLPAVSVNGLIDGGVTLTMPLATTAVALQYTSTQTAPTNIPSLTQVSGVNNVPGYIVVTPSTSVTFLAGQKIVLQHPNDQNNQSNSGSSISAQTPGATSGSNNPGSNNTGSNNSGSNNNGSPLIAIYDSSQPTLGWVTGIGTYSTDSVFQYLTYTLPANETLQANVTYYFGIYM